MWQTAGMRTCYSCLYRPESGYLTEIRDTPQEEYEEILTDDPALYEQIRTWMELSCPEALPALRLYQDSAVSLSNLYGLPRNPGGLRKTGMAEKRRLSGH